MIDPQLLEFMTPAEIKHLDAILQSMPKALWQPLPGPQSMAWESIADVVGFGGAAGGGKTDLAVGKAILQHERSMIVRSIGTELTAVVDRIAELLGGRDGLNGKDMIWRLEGRKQIEFGSIPNVGDEGKYRGRPHDLVVFDEATAMREYQVRFLLGWLRTTTPGQRCQALLTFNPPSDAEGRWVIDFFAPWLDPKHPCPALPGELRWFANLDGKEVELAGGTPFTHQGEQILPQSRTFIPSRVTDNPYLMGTGYMAQLQSMPEPLRSQLLYGDFNAGMEDDPWQVIPTAWVDIAMARWKPRDVKGPMKSIGVDVARGGKDNTVISRRHDGWWFDELLAYPGTATPDGPLVMALTLKERRDNAPVHIDVIGVGSSPYDFLRAANVQVVPVNVAESATTTDKSGAMTFANLRSQYWWKMRELLDPSAGNGIALPPDQRLLADLCAPRWKPQGRVIVVESREQIISRIHRSPDYASGLILAAIETPRIEDIPGAGIKPPRPPHNPYVLIQHDVAHNVGNRPYDPYSRMK